MKNEPIKKAMDASVKRKTEYLTVAIENAVEGINSLLITLRHEMFVKCPTNAVGTLQQLAEAAAYHAVTASVYAAQLTTLKCMQEAVDLE